MISAADRSTSVKVLIISDLHANLEAIEELPKKFDQPWVLGDLVNYGPDLRNLKIRMEGATGYPHNKCRTSREQTRQPTKPR